MNIYLESIKNPKSATKTEKYRVIQCQETIDKNIDTTRWLILQEIIKNTKDLRIFKGILTDIHKIVVKIGKSDTIKREYDISHLLLSIPNFIIYLCYFSCNNDIDKITSNSSVCAKEGDILQILVMKEYPLGDIKHYQWSIENFHILKSLIKQIIISLFIAFIETGFLHNDVHYGNFLIKENDKVLYYSQLNITLESSAYVAVIMDFENSLFDDTKTHYDFLYKCFIQIINGIDWYLDIKTTNSEEVNSYLLQFSKIKKKIDINHLLVLIDKITFIERIDKTKIFKYNPNIF